MPYGIANILPPSLLLPPPPDLPPPPSCDVCLYTYALAHRKGESSRLINVGSGEGKESSLTLSLLFTTTSVDEEKLPTEEWSFRSPLLPLLLLLRGFR